MPSRPGLQRGAVITGLILAGAWFVWALSSRYSPREPYHVFLEPTRGFLRLGLASDSAGLARLDADPSAIRWVLDAGRRNREALRILVSGLQGGYGMRNGDSRVVFFTADSLAQCEGWPLTISFSGPPKTARIVSVTAKCGLEEAPQ